MEVLINTGSVQYLRTHWNDKLTMKNFRLVHVKRKTFAHFPVMDQQFSFRHRKRKSTSKSRTDTFVEA